MNTRIIFNRHLPVAVLAYAILSTTDVAAQPGVTAAVELDALNRARPELDPLGVRAGGMMLFPSIELGLAYDDNVYRQSSDVATDSVRYFRPRMYGVSRWSRHEFRFDAGLDSSDFTELNTENLTNWYTGLGGRLDISRDSWLRADLTLRKLNEERGNPESPFTALKPVSRRMSDFSVEAFRRLNRLTLGIEATYTGLAYEDAVDAINGRPLMQSDRDRSERAISGRIGLNIASGTELFLRRTNFIRRYDRPQSVDLYVRDSDGSETAFGLRLDLGTLIGGEVFGGYRKQTYDRDERLPEVKGISYGGALTWNATPLTTIRGTASRTINESALRQASGYLASSLVLGLDHELRRNLLIGGGLSLTSNEYVGIERDDEILTGTIRAIWKFNRRTRAEGGFRMQDRESTFLQDNYDKNYFYLNVRFSI